MGVPVPLGSGICRGYQGLAFAGDRTTTTRRNPPPVAADAAIWKTVLNAYSNAVGGPTNSGLVAAARSAKHAAWRWTPSFGGTLLVCVNVSI
jgi:hypothetical protein